MKHRRDAISVVTPTLGAPTLVPMLMSCLFAGLQPDDEIVLVADTHGELGPHVLHRVRSIALPFAEQVQGSRGFTPAIVIAEHDAGYHAHGNPQRRLAVDLASRPWIVGQDEDDVFTERAFDVIRRAIEDVLDKGEGPCGFGAELAEPKDARPRPLMFRFECLIRPPGVKPWREILPVRDEIVESKIDGHSMVYPNQKALLGRWTDRYESDADFMLETVANYRAIGLEPAWHKAVIGVARPHQAPYATKSALAVQA